MSKNTIISTVANITTNYIPKANGTSITNSLLYDSGTRIGLGTNNPQRLLELFSSTADSHLRLSGNAPSVSLGEAVTDSIYQAKFGLVTANGQYASGSVAGDFVIIAQTGATIFSNGTSTIAKFASTGAATFSSSVTIGATNSYNFSAASYGFLGYNSETNGMSIAMSSATRSGGPYRMSLSSNAGFDFTNAAGSSLFLSIASTGAATFSSNVTANNGVQAQVIGSDGTYGSSYPMYSFTGTTNGSSRIFSGGANDYMYFASATGGGFQFRPNGSASSSFKIESTGAATFSSSVTVTGSLSKGSGSFRIDHPLESMSKTHQLVHSFVEAPQADLYYRGKIKLINGKGQANIDEVATMTEGTFEALCREVQCFTTNESGWDLIKGKVIGNIIYIESQNINSTDEISWLVIGERQDKHMMDTEWTDNNGKVIVEPLKELNAKIEELRKV